MGEIKDYPCTYGSKEDSVAGLLEKCGLAVPDVYQRADSMVKLARTVKEGLHDQVVYLPFDHVVEAEALGAVVNYGSVQAGPRTGEYVCTSLEDVLSLPDMDVAQGLQAPGRRGRNGYSGSVWSHYAFKRTRRSEIRVQRAAA